MVEKQVIDTEKLKEFIKQITPKCPYCGADTSYAYYDGAGGRYCPNCMKNLKGDLDDELLIFGIIMLWVIIAEYILLDFYYFRREMKLRNELFEQHMEDIETIFRVINNHADGVKKDIKNAQKKSSKIL